MSDLRIAGILCILLGAVFLLARHKFSRKAVAFYKKSLKISYDYSRYLLSVTVVSIVIILTGIIFIVLG